MAAHDDLSLMDFFGEHDAPRLVAVGWLSRERSYSRGDVPREVYDRLKQLLCDPWQPIAAGGAHGCELCRFEPEARNGSNLFLPDGARIYCAPAMILHYINAHEYAPPSEFCDAVMKCPETRSMEYKRLLLASGWKAIGPRE